MAIDDLAGLRIASVRRRVLASAFDAAFFIAAVGATLRIAVEVSRHDGESSVFKWVHRAAETGRPFGLSKRWQRALAIVLSRCPPAQERARAWSSHPAHSAGRRTYRRSRHRPERGCS